MKITATIEIATSNPKVIEAVERALATHAAGEDYKASLDPTYRKKEKPTRDAVDELPILLPEMQALKPKALAQMTAKLKGFKRAGDMVHFGLAGLSPVRFWFQTTFTD